MSETSANDTHAPSPQPMNEREQSIDAELAPLGITTHQHTSYEWNGYRYSNASDAVAAVERATR